MNCPKCGGQNVMVEGLSNGNSKQTCQSCGHVEVKNNKGQTLILDEREMEPKPRMLTEAR